MPNEPWSPAAWESRAFDGFRDLLDTFAEHRAWPTLGELECRWLEQYRVDSVSGAPLRLIEQKGNVRPARPRSRRDLYDVSTCSGQLPTRPCNWHDFFNVLIFVAFARSKRVLHGRHCRILEQRVPEQLHNLPGARTREQDHLAMLDEGGVLLAVDSVNAASLAQMLEAAQHERLRSAIELGQVRPWLIGHAHLEHLAINALSKTTAPLPRAKPVLLEVGANASRDRVDDALAVRLAAPSVEFLQNGWRAVPLECLYGNLPPASLAGNSRM